MSLCVEETRDTDSGRCQTKTGIWSDKYLNPWLMGMTYRWKQLNSRSYNTCVYIRIYLDINIFYVCVVHFDMKMRVAPQRRAIFNVSAEQLHPELGIIEKTQRFATFLTFAACVSSFQWLYSRVDRLSAVYSRVDCLSADLTSAFQLSIHKSLPFLLFVVTQRTSANTGGFHLVDLACFEVFEGSRILSAECHAVGHLWACLPFRRLLHDASRKLFCEAVGVPFFV